MSLLGKQLVTRNLGLLRKSVFVGFAIKCNKQCNKPDNQSP